MVHTCFLCKWRSDKPPRRSYHKFPSNTELKQKWLDICGKSNLSVGERTSLCNVHFEESCFRYGLVMGRKILKDGSVPTLHLSRSANPKTFTELGDAINPNESQMENNLLTQQPAKDPTSDSNHLTFIKNPISQLKIENTLMEIPVEFSLPKSFIKRTHSESDDEQQNIASQDQKCMECRVCLQRYDYEAQMLYIFQPWETQWDGMGDSIAQDLSQIANIHITSTDPFSKQLCQFCHQRLLEACSFVVKARTNDKLLRQRAKRRCKQETSWTEQIQQENEIINSNTFNTNMIEVKQEALSDDETYDKDTHNTFKDGGKSIDWQNLYNDWEIKVEHNEIKEPSIIRTTVNGSDTESECGSGCGAPRTLAKKKLRTEIVQKKCVTTFSRQDFESSEAQSTDNGSRGGLPLQITGDIVIEHGNNQMEECKNRMEIDDEKPGIDHLHKPRNNVGVRSNKAPKTSTERGREFRARKALLKKQNKLQQEPDAIVQIATEDIHSAGLSEDNQVLGPSEIRTIEKRAKSAETTRRWRMKKKEQSLQMQRGDEERKRGRPSKEHAKTAAQRMREYRKRKKNANIYVY